MYKLEFTLKQHTPIIHFQHYQEGATLRASEVKPKLDRFIMTQIGKEKIPKDWFSIADRDSLAYKLVILPIKSDKYIVANRMSGGAPGQKRVLTNAGWNCIEFSSYFAQEKEIGELFINNITKENNKKVNHFQLVNDFQIKVTKLKTLGLFTADDLKIRFTCYNEALKRAIAEHLISFFISHNFGTRQTKGFGCFLPKNITDQDIIKYLKENKKIKGIFKLSNSSSFESKLKKINDDYTRLKRGESYPIYQKSELWEYLCTKQRLSWEKKAIKMHIKSNDSSLFKSLKYDNKKPIHKFEHYVDSCLTNENNSHYYIRALLGLAEQFEFAKQFGNERIKVKIDDVLHFRSLESEKAKEIERFASPMRYFISNTSIFITTIEIPIELSTYKDERSQLQNRKFRFTISDLNTNDSFDLPVPQTFDLENFIKVKAGYGINLK